ncbi:sulfotransferase 1A1-like [Saccoglossus kowalevskii]|uniref:Sulfotransferase 1C4-like isoform X2 n=1 Tax=Saccoglossus kowalevskii TaxID=10224 RepID=A0ABM0M4X5_SACKO|nr:PREDICTED: sulfotransferase 1C4-like isoform X2 [Saccoglossus kowalevskii]
MKRWTSLRRRLTSAKEEDKKKEKEDVKSKSKKREIAGKESPIKDRKTGCHEYEGVCLPVTVTTASLDMIKMLEIRDDDVWVLNYPRSGGLWIQEIVSCVINGADLDSVTNIPIADRLIRLENMENNKNNAPQMFEKINNMESPRMIRTSLPYHMLPFQIHSKKPKIIYMARNPKDVVASYYHFYNSDPVLPTTTWEKFIEEFIKGNVAFGSWFPHLSPWWQEYRTSNNVLFLKYEDLKKDLRSIVIQISLFLDKHFEDDQIEAITNHCGFDNMKNAAGDADAMISTYLRKGIVGSWEEQFTIAQNKTFDLECDKHLYGTGLRFDYESFKVE